MCLLTFSLFNKWPYLLFPFFLIACDKFTKASSPPPLPPYRIALSDMGKDFQQEVSNIQIQQVLSSRENPTTATVTIEQTDLLDDSVQAAKSIFQLVFRDGKWVIDSRVNQQRCYNERGHHDFSTAPCYQHSMLWVLWNKLVTFSPLQSIFFYFGFSPHIASHQQIECLPTDSQKQMKTAIGVRLLNTILTIAAQRDIIKGKMP